MKDGRQFYCRDCSSARYKRSKLKRSGPPKTKHGLRPAEIPVGHKWCADCGEIKVLAAFSRNTRDRSGYRKDLTLRAIAYLDGADFGELADVIQIGGGLFTPLANDDVEQTA